MHIMEVRMAYTDPAVVFVYYDLAIATHFGSVAIIILSMLQNIIIVLAE